MARIFISRKDGIMKRFILLLALASLIGATAAARGSAEGAPLTELNISYVRSPFNLQVMVMKELGMLEKEFEADGITVNWYEITSGAEQAQAMAAGSLDIASVMNTASVIIANSAGNDVKIIDIVSRPERTFTIMAMEDGPATVRDLAGKTVAGPKGTVLHQLLATVIDQEDLEDVDFVSMGLPQAQTALISGSIDAALLAGALVLKTQEAGGRIVTTSEGYVTPLLVSVAPSRFIENHGDIVRRYQAVQREAFEYIDSNLGDALEIGAAAQDISPEDAAELYARSGIASAFTTADLVSLGEDVTFLLDLEMIEETVEPVDLVSAIVDVQ
jgi:sulfonate transport system substrate-binding protein